MNLSHVFGKWLSLSVADRPSSFEKFYRTPYGGLDYDDPDYEEDQDEVDYIQTVINVYELVGKDMPEIFATILMELKMLQNNI